MTGYYETFTFSDGRKVSIRRPNDTTKTVIEDSQTDWYTSYNNVDTRIYGCDTTALVISNQIKTTFKKDKVYHGDNFYILKGDFREEYSKCNCLDEAIEVYLNNIKKRSKYTQDIYKFIQWRKKITAINKGD